MINTRIGWLLYEHRFGIISRQSKVIIEVLYVVVKNFVGLFYVSYTGQPHINGQAGLQGLKSAFNASLGLGNAAGTYFDAQQFAGITELCGDVIFFGG